MLLAHRPVLLGRSFERGTIFQAARAKLKAEREKAKKKREAQMAALASKRDSQLTTAERARQQELQREAQAAAEEEAKEMASDKFANFVDSEEEVSVSSVVLVSAYSVPRMLTPFFFSFYFGSLRRLKRHRRLHVRTRLRLLFIHTCDPAMLLALPR